MRTRWAGLIVILVGAATGLAIQMFAAQPAAAAEVVRSCNAVSCDEELYFQARPGERNNVEAAITSYVGEGRKYWIWDRNVRITLGEAFGAFAGNGCHHPTQGQVVPFQDDPRPSHVVWCRWGDDGRVVMHLGDGNDRAVVFQGGLVTGGAGKDAIRADSRFVDGGSGSDVLTGDEYGRNVLRGGAGNDTLDGDLGADDIHGGTGVDTVRFSSLSQYGGRLNVTLGDGNPNDGSICDRYAVTPGGCDGRDLGRADEIFGDVEKVIGGPGDDRVTGDSGADELVGRAGNDFLRGGGGADVLWGGGLLQTEKALVAFGGVNDLAGGDGNDTLIGGFEADSLSGGGGDDTLHGDHSGAEEGSDGLSGGPGNDMLDGGDRPFQEDGSPTRDTMVGGPGVDRVTYATRIEAVRISLDDVADDGENGEGDNVSSDIEDVEGGFAGDTLIGSRIDNLLIGNEGDDQLQGMLGADTFVGGSGSDAVSYAERSTTIVASINGDFDDGEVFMVDERATSEGDNIRLDVESIIGGSGDDEFHASKSGSELFGGAGNDVLTGGSGIDTLHGEVGDDTFFAQDGVADSVFGGDGKDAAQVDDVDSVDSIEQFL